MQPEKPQYPVLALSIPLLAGIVYSSCTGFFSADFYSLETLNWQIQSKGQDMIDLFLVAPVLAISTFMAYKGSKIGLLIWAGTNLYLVYTFLIFCLAVHFNSLFLVYCLNLGLAFYSMLYFITRIVEVEKWFASPGHTLKKITAIYFLGISILFLGLWLTDVISWMQEWPVPKTLQDIGLLTNPVHVIDLSVFLPGVFITGILLLRNKVAGILLAPVLLSFFILMDLTIAVLNFMMHEIIPGTTGVLTWVMIILALASWILLVLHLTAYKNLSKNLYASNTDQMSLAP